MEKRLCLSRHDKKIAGVCGGIAEYFNLEPSLVRMVMILSLLVFRGAPLIIYIVCWAVIPNSQP